MGLFLCSDLPIETMQKYLSLVKFSHTIFALPFALLGFFLGIHQDNINYKWEILLLVILCMVFARSAAMAFNRYADRYIDSKNPRTSEREIPAGQISPQHAIVFVLINSVAFIICCYFINKLCFYLSPIALLITLGYSYTKRFTSMCHVILGLGLSLAPIGAFVAATGYFQLIPLLYSAVVLFWVAGFDIIYALQDDEFDLKNSLKSIPSSLGKKKALLVSRVFHILSAIFLVMAALHLNSSLSSFSWLHMIAVAVFISLLVFQHSLVKVNDLSKINLAFFTTNGVASILFCSLVIIDFYI
jgi:4-hydroxybenzoate polyprenyltransferase